ncbi:hypothetical protein HPB48_013935 [Haemaphysalis longicornis]|uniref:Uncharacterized protein n=1 Tax=Haemaphysalis longicornis TaxID=44386 RepID=A0A9J6GTD3_HAELO|nr:hypothetical protein HPB48_013935 [Haemaphysalis longicornis]
MSSGLDVVCTKCTDSLNGDESSLLWYECKDLYHLGECSGVSQAAYKSIRDEYKKSWKSPRCRKNKSGPSRAKPTQDATIATVLLEINRKLDELMPLTNTVKEIEASIKAISDKYESILCDVAKHDS